MIVAFPPGNSTDIVARLVADELTKVWGRQVVIDNRAGGNNIPGTLAGKNAPPDGHTITFATSASIGVNPSLYTNLPYDPPKDFAMVHGVFTVPWIIVAHPSAYNSLKEVVDAAKKSPGTLQMGYGATSLQLGAELFKYRTGITMQGIPYKGSAPAITDLLGAQIVLLYDTVAATMPHVKAGKLKALSVMTPKRVPLLPDVPTATELGYAGVEAYGWGGMVVPKATPNAVVQKISGDVGRIMNDPAMQQKILERGAVPDPRGPKEWTAFVNSELVKWADIVKRANVKAD